MQFPSASSAPTKREVLAKLAKVYDPPGLASPITLQGKQIYLEACHCKVSWDAPIPENLKIRWQRWEQSLPAEVTTRRPLAPYQQPVISAELHVFGDASNYGVGAAVYSVVRQEDGITQTLVAEFSNVIEEFRENTQCNCQQTPCLRGSLYKGFMSKPYMEVCPLPWQRFVNSTGSQP